MELTVIDTALAQALASQYPSMRSLDLRNNNIVAIHDLQPLSQLQELALDGNRLTTLNGLSSLPFLTSLSARSNLITELGDAITTLSSLSILDLAWNRLGPGPWVSLLPRLPRLTDLDLRGNPVCDLEGGTHLLAAALPGLQRLNGVQLRPEPQDGPSSARAQAQEPHSGPHSHAGPHGALPPAAAELPLPRPLQAPQPRPQAYSAPAHHTLQPSQQPSNSLWSHNNQIPAALHISLPPGSGQATADAGPVRGALMPPGPSAASAAAVGISGVDTAAVHHPMYLPVGHLDDVQAVAEGGRTWPQPPAPALPDMATISPGWRLAAAGGGGAAAAIPASLSAAAAATSAAAPAQLQLQLPAAARTRDALEAAHEALRDEHARLGQRAARLEDALRQAEGPAHAPANAPSPQDSATRLQQQLQQQSAASVQQVATLAGQVGALVVDRDAAARRAEALAERLAEAEARGEAEAAAAGRAAQQVAELQAAARMQEAEMSATQELLLSLQQQHQQLKQQHQEHQQHQQRQGQQSGQAGGASSPPRDGMGPAAQPPRDPHHVAATAGVSALPGGGSPSGGCGGARLEAALQQRVAALQQVVKMQERELVRLGGLADGHPQAGGGGGGGQAGAQPAVDNVLQPWREQVASLHEQLGRVSAEGDEQRAEWGRQLGEMREQFTQARMLLEVLEQRSWEQRSEVAQLQARAAALGAELQRERGRAAGLEQQLAGRDAAAQAVRRQLLAFQTHMQQRERSLEDRADQLAAQAERLSHATRRLTFARGLAALRGRGRAGGGDDDGGAPAPGRGARALPEGYGPTGRLGVLDGGNPGAPWGSHVALQGRLAMSPAAKLAHAASAGWTPDRGPGLAGLYRGAGESEGHGPGGRAGGDAGGGAAAAAAGDTAPLVAVLRREVAQLGGDRDMLLQRLAQVSSAAEERIRSALAAAEERETRHREGLLAARLQAAQQAVEAAAERKVRAAEAEAAAREERVRRQVQAAAEALEELCRRTEAAAGLQLSRMAVRLQDLARQVERLLGARQRSAEQQRASSRELERLRQELETSRAAEAELRRQLAGRDREAHARVAELRAEGEEALAAERRRTAEAERLATQAAAECGQLERQLARVREVKAQQEDAKLRRLQTQVHEQETQLRSLRRERNALLAELRKHTAGGRVAGAWAGPGADAARAAAEWEEEEEEGEEERDDLRGPRGDTAAVVDDAAGAGWAATAAGGLARAGASVGLSGVPGPLRHAWHIDGSADNGLPDTTTYQHPHQRVVPEPRRNVRAAGAGGANSIRSILRGGAALPPGARAPASGPAEAAAASGGLLVAAGRDAAGVGTRVGVAGASPAAAAGGSGPGAGAEGRLPGPGGLSGGPVHAAAGRVRERPAVDPGAAHRLDELEALTAELLSLD